MLLSVQYMFRIVPIHHQLLITMKNFLVHKQTLNHILVKQADIYLLECESIYLLIKIQIFLNILKVQLLVKRHVTIVVLQYWILQTLLLNLKLKKRYISNGKDLI